MVSPTEQYTIKHIHNKYM